MCANGFVLTFSYPSPLLSYSAHIWPLKQERIKETEACEAFFTNRIEPITEEVSDFLDFDIQKIGLTSLNFSDILSYLTWLKKGPDRVINDRNIHIYLFIYTI
jgi:hypothetical protein